MMQRIVFRDVTPVTPNGYAVKAAVGDDVIVGAVVVRDGHGLVSSRVRWRPVGPPGGSDDRPGRRPRWPMPATGRCRGVIRLDTPGLYEFEVQAWLDRFATWRRDLSRRASAGDDLAAEFEVGARLIESLTPSTTERVRARLAETVATLRSAGCSDAVRVSAGTDRRGGGTVGGRARPGRVGVLGPAPAANRP